MATTFELPSDGSAPTSLENGKDLTFDEPCFALSAGELGDYDSEVKHITPMNPQNMAITDEGRI